MWYQGFNFKGFNPLDEKYKDKIDTFFKVFESLNLLDFFTYDFSIDVYYLDVVSVIKGEGSYFKELSLLSNYIYFNESKNGIYGRKFVAEQLNKIIKNSNGRTFQKFMNEVKKTNKNLRLIVKKLNEKGSTRKDIFTIIKYLEG